MTKAQFSITGIEVKACHGVLDTEKIYPQLFIVDVSYSYDISKAAVSDILADSVDYSSVQKVIVNVLKGQSVELIEKLAINCKRAVETVDLGITDVKITLHKPEASLAHKFNDVTIEV
ncbi:7,8-dihydroneopterin aldolase [Actinomycetota bacterium]|nr:7,8-dihydroneopterin aldolase [Actinomycetota bacterium]